MDVERNAVNKYSQRGTSTVKWAFNYRGLGGPWWYTLRMEKRDWLLLALHFAGARGLSPVQLQKSLFLLAMEVPEVRQDFYEFVPHNYGPFSKQIYLDAEVLDDNGCAAIEPHGSYSQYLITEAGREHLKAIEKRGGFSERAYNYLSDAVGWTQRQGFSSLVRAIYKKYPAYRVNSVFQY